VAKFSGFQMIPLDIMIGRKVLTAMERMSRLKRIGPEDLTALRKIGTWPQVEETGRIY